MTGGPPHTHGQADGPNLCTVAWQCGQRSLTEPSPTGELLAGYLPAADAE
jgi:hypothetical protein